MSGYNSLANDIDSYGKKPREEYLEREVARLDSIVNELENKVKNQRLALSKRQDYLNSLIGKLSFKVWLFINKTK